MDAHPDWRGPGPSTRQATGKSVSQTDGSTTLPCARKSGQERGICTHPAGFTGPNAHSLHYLLNLKWCSREDSHLEPPPSQGGVQNSYTSGAKWCVMSAGGMTGPHPRQCIGTVSLEETHAAVTPMTRSKVVAASGIAPDSPRLQRGANLSQLHSRVVPPRGIAPRSPGYQPGALLLSYGGIDGRPTR